MHEIKNKFMDLKQLLLEKSINENDVLIGGLLWVLKVLTK
jgi:hypothetical protein